MTFLFILLLQSFSYADCPQSTLIIDNQEYCAEVSWQNTDKKLNGEFYSTQVPSPYLNPRSAVPQNWHYSKLEVQIWESSDRNKQPVYFENLTIKPYMYMKNGHHHSTSYQYNFSDGLYKLSNIAFHEMMGCWTLNWEYSNLQQGVLLKIYNFNNLSESDKQTYKNFCDSI